MKKNLSLNEKAIRELLQTPMTEDFWGELELSKRDLGGPDTLLSFFEATCHDLVAVVNAINKHLQGSALSYMLAEYLGGSSFVVEFQPPALFLVGDEKEVVPKPEPEPEPKEEEAPPPQDQDQPQAKLEDTQGKEGPTPTPKTTTKSTLPPLADLRSRAEELGLDPTPYGKRRRDLLDAILEKEQAGEIKESTSEEEPPAPLNTAPEPPPTQKKMFRTGDPAPVEIIDLDTLANEGAGEDEPEADPEPEVSPEEDPAEVEAGPEEGEGEGAEETPESEEASIPEPETEEPEETPQNTCDECDAPLEGEGTLFEDGGGDVVLCDQCYQARTAHQEQLVEEPEEEDDAFADLLSGSTDGPLEITFNDEGADEEGEEDSPTFEFEDGDMDLLEGDDDEPVSDDEPTPDDGSLANDPEGRKLAENLHAWGQKKKEENADLETLLDSADMLALDRFLDE